MNYNSVVFIAFEERENLGVRYMAAVLSGGGYKVHIIDFRKKHEEILKELHQAKPFIVGFSIIFEDHIYHFRDLIAYLRKEGISSHFTAGGHYASLKPAELYEIIPSLDSIVRFEGERTMLELVNHLFSKDNWKGVTGIAYKEHEELICNSIRPLEPDLDNYPYPIRSGFKEYVLDKHHTTLMAGRGCVYNCIYCNIGEFYRLPRGPSKRIRDPVKVVEEMVYYYAHHDCVVFLFQDDDFPVITKAKYEWINKFCAALKENGLVGKIIWKINCRPDEIEREPFEMMKEHGLFRVYLGIEDGTDEGLQQMNKKQQASDNLRGVNILKDLELCIDFGFMLFQPHTTFKSFRENLYFLQTISGDGYMPITFLKMLPYFGTRLEMDLRSEGRLKGKPGFLDYDFLEKPMNDFHRFVFKNFNTWLNAADGLENTAQWAKDYMFLYGYFYGSPQKIAHLSEELYTLVSTANLFMLKTLEELSVIFESGKYELKHERVLNEYKSSIDKTHDTIVMQMSEILGNIELFTFVSNLFIA